MSREQFRARSKKVQKLGRDGLIEQDKATGQEKRISQRAADISFGPDRTPEQGPLRRTTSQGRKPRQRPRPAPPSEAARIDVPDVGWSDAATPSAPDAVRPNTAAPSAPDMARYDSAPDMDTPDVANPAALDTIYPDVSNVHSASAPPPAMRGADDTPAQISSLTSPNVHPSKKQRQRKQMEKLRQEEAPAPTSGGPEAGRLKFEDGSAETEPTAKLDRPHLRFEDDPDQETPNAQDANHAPDAPSAQDVERVADAPPPSRRRQRRYETSERRVIQPGRRLDKAQTNIPAQRRARLAPEYDATTGRVRRRLRFEDETAPEQATPSLPAQAGGVAKTAAVGKLHGRLREAEQNNVAVEAAHEGEFAAERGAGRLLRRSRRLRSESYRAARQAEGRLRTEQAQLAWQSALQDNPELRRQGVLTKWIQKRKLKRRYAQAAREAKAAAQHTRQTATGSGKILQAAQRYASAHKGALLIVAALALGIGFFSAGLASCTVMLSGVQSASVSASYLADDQEICDSDLYFTELETDLQLDIANTEINHPGYDEYRYNIGEISHNPYELMNYLSATRNAFTFEQTRPEIERLFAEKYQLTRTTVTETRYDDEGNPYEWKVLQTTLTVNRLGDSLSASLLPGEQTERYNLYARTYGSRQAFASPFDFPWLGYVTSGYGYRVHPTTGAKDLHRGVDIAAAQGTPIKAVRDGRVVSAGDAGSYGLCVVIEDDKGYQARYAHCSSLSVSAGQEVKRGDVIGAVGSTGDSTGPHLHLEVLRNGAYLNPYYFVDNGDDGSGGALPGTPGGPTIPDYSGEPMGGDTYSAMIAEAEKYLGFPYVWGGTNPSTSFDCAGYVSWVINHSGWNYGRLGVMGLEDVCTPVSLAGAQPGDLVFFIGTYDAPNPNRPSHVGIYAGNGRFIHCGDPISYANLSEPYWVNHLRG